MILPPCLVPSADLRLVCFPASCVVLDVRRGTVRLLSEEAAEALVHLRSSGGVTSTSRERKRVLLALLAAEILLPGTRHRDWDRVRLGVPSSASWGASETPAALEPLPPTFPRWYVLGALALAVVLSCGVGSRGGAFTRTRRLVAKPARGTIDHDVALEVARAVRRVGRLVPLRVACWEEAAATSIALRWAGFRASFRHGVATDPVRLHAWVEVCGRAVAEADDITDYTPFEELRE